MSEEVLIKKMVESVGNVPPRADVFALRQYSLEDVKQRTKRFLAMTAEAYALSLERSDWVVQKNRTLVRLPQRARAVVYHGSGMMKFVTGLNPMESLFEKIEDREILTKLVEETTDRLKIREWAGNRESLKLERLWQIKAAAADLRGQVVDPVLCRVVGAYRHFVGQLPVWGAASIAIKLAGGGKLDSLAIQMRETTGQTIDRPKILPPDRAARQICLQLRSIMGNSRISPSEVAVPQWLRFGYLSLNKRKSQRLLAPVYIAAIEIEGQEEAQAYIFATSATEKTYLPLELNGSETSAALLDRTSTPLPRDSRRPSEEDEV